MTTAVTPVVLAEYRCVSVKFQAIEIPDSHKPRYELHAFGQPVGEIHCSTMQSAMRLFDFITAATVAGRDIDWLFA